MRILNSLITRVGMYYRLFVFFIALDPDSKEFYCSPGLNQFLDLKMYNDSKPQNNFFQRSATLHQ